MLDYLKYYDLERYLFEDVHQRFHHEHSLGAFDFFSIVIWKANRAKSKIALKLLARDRAGRRDLDAIVRTLTTDLYAAPDGKARLRLLLKDWNFALPMASAILSVLWLDEFTVYDYRVCDRLDKFHDLYHWTDFERVWTGYGEFKASVRATAPSQLSLRDQDRYLWGESAATQLQHDIQQLFQRDEQDEP